MRLRGVEQRKQLWLNDAIIDIPALTAIAHQAGRAQRRQLLRDVGLPVAQVRLQMADARLATAQQLDNRKPGRVHQRVE